MSFTAGGKNKVLRDYFISTGFFDLFDRALGMARALNYSDAEVIEAVCKVSDKFNSFPPVKNRAAWFDKVFKEKLAEARADILAHRVAKNYR
ncbi:MAG: hypothetical protein WC715_06325 [Patescibacteria group bacterium]